MTPGVRWVGARGLAMIACAVLAGAVLSWPEVTFTRWRYASGQTIYPWWTWLLVGAMAGAGAVLVLAPDGPVGRPWRLGAAAATLVVGVELAGTGVVAARHWKPAQGMGGYPGETRVLEALAVVLAVLALTAVVVAVTQLLLDHAVGRSSTTWRARVAVGLGVVVVAVVPLLMIAGPGRALTSWGAAGLLYAGPWGAAIVASAWLERTAATVALGAVTVLAAVAAGGPHMTDLLLTNDAALACVGGAAGAMALAVARWGPQPGTGPEPWR